MGISRGAFCYRKATPDISQARMYRRDLLQRAEVVPFKCSPDLPLSANGSRIPTHSRFRLKIGPFVTPFHGPRLNVLINETVVMVDPLGYDWYEHA